MWIVKGANLGDERAVDDGLGSDVPEGSVMLRGLSEERLLTVVFEADFELVGDLCRMRN